jgi:hypothetical protein
MYRYNQENSARIPYNSIDPSIEQVGNDILSGDISGAIQDSISAALSIIKGRPGTTGKRKLGEAYLKHVMDQNITSSQNVTEQQFNQAIDYFTKAFGVPITTIEDLDNLDPNYDTSGSNVRDYKARDPLYANIPDSLVQRAVEIKRQLPYSMSHWNFNTAYNSAGLTGSSAAGSNLPTGNTMKIVLYIGGAILGIIVIIVVIKLIRK